MGQRQGQMGVNRTPNNRPGGARTKRAKPIQPGRRAPDAPSKPIEVALGATLQQLRQSRGLSQTELGCRLGVSLQQVQKYESGRDRMAASTLFRAAEILGVEVGALYAGLLNKPSRTRGSSKTQRNAVFVMPLTVSPRSAPAREAELIDVVRSYQGIANAPDRALVRNLLKRVSGISQRTGRTSR